MPSSAVVSVVLLFVNTDDKTCRLPSCLETAPPFCPAVFPVNSLLLMVPKLPAPPSVPAVLFSNIELKVFPPELAPIALVDELPLYIEFTVATP